MRALGIDYGMARIGIALSDPTGLFAQPHSVLKRVSDERAAQDIFLLAQDVGAERIVVGWPKNMNGTEGPRAHQCAAFAEQLREATGLPVDLFDERLTTVAAERLLISAEVGRANRKQVIDSVAASVMLQGYLDRERSRANKP